MIQVRYFAGAREAAGISTEDVPGPTTAGGLRAALIARHGTRFGEILPRCALLVSGARAPSDEIPVPDGITVDVLPPFAGG